MRSDARVWYVPRLPNGMVRGVIGLMFHRIYVTKVTSTNRISVDNARANSRRTRCRIVALPMTSINPAAAKGVNVGIIRVTRGALRPIAALFRHPKEAAEQGRLHHNVLCTCDSVVVADTRRQRRRENGQGCGLMR